MRVFGGSTGLPEYAQEAGRARRDGKGAQCTIIYNKKYADEHTAKTLQDHRSQSFSTQEYLDDRTQNWQLICDYMSKTNSCRKHFIYSHIDGCGPGMCLFDSNSVNCDVCDDHLNALTPNDERPVSPEILPPLQDLPFPQPLPILSQSPNPLTPLAGQSYPSFSNFLQSPHLPSDNILQVSRRLSFSNHSSGAASHPLPITAPSSTNLLHDFRTACNSLQNLCVPCVVFDSKQELSEHRCKHMRNRCRICFSTGHQVGTCQKFDPKRKNFCYGCSLSQVKGENIHRADEFGKNCFMGIARNIAWAFWIRDRRARELLAVSLFRDIELSNLQQAEHTASPDEECNKFYDTWLRTDWNGIPNFVRFLVWWFNAARNVS